MAAASYALAASSAVLNVPIHLQAPPGVQTRCYHVEAERGPLAGLAKERACINGMHAVLPGIPLATHLLLFATASLISAA